MTLTLQQQFGPIDIYLFDQLLRGNIVPGMRILDAGCGHGRNLVYLLRAGYEVYGIDANADAVAEVLGLTRILAPSLPEQNFRVERIEEMSFAGYSFNVVLLNAVLHFAESEAHFMAMVESAWRVLCAGGLLFCRLASTIGMEQVHHRVSGRRFLSPDGAERFLVDEDLLLKVTAALGGELVDPLKTTVVQNQRAMTTWVVRKRR